VETILAGERPVRQSKQGMPAMDLLAAAFALHADTLMGYVGELVGPAEAEDAVAEVWVRIAEAGDRIDSRVLDMPWLRMIARSVVSGRPQTPEVPVGLADAVRAYTPAPSNSPVVVHESGAQEEFRVAHDDVTTWSAIDFEVYDNLAGAPATAARAVRTA
jgi:DNA-directed RNA polymerase specialized sigma24 family protein